ncbi:MAG: hypothetical protein Q3974_03865 [Rothia sp. (in: high G+C Gram-positive bacteria)]|nr:hypothetical protein [Rothia sp. (in: high G+C Gram-positive bacteria)]
MNNGSIDVIGTSSLENISSKSITLRHSEEGSEHIIFTGESYSKAESKISLQIGRNDNDATEPRLAAEETRDADHPMDGKECVTNDGKGTNGRLVAVPLPLGEVEGTGSYDTDVVGNFGCLPTKGGGKKTVTVVNPVTGKTVKVEPIVISVSHEDFENQPIKPASLTMDNAPKSLKNYNTNIFAKSGEQRFNDNIMGENVEIKAIPISYTFNYGDGTTVTTTNPGYSVGSQWDVRTPTSHQYKKPGKYIYTVTTTFRGEFRVPGGPWQVVPGTSNRVSTPQGVDVWRVKAGNVDGK